MNLSTTYKETLNTNFTYTPTECRLKIGTRDQIFNIELMDFSQQISNSLSKRHYPFALRGRIDVLPKSEGCKFFIQLKDNNKNVLFTARYTSDFQFFLVDKRTFKDKLIRKFNSIVREFNRIKNIIRRNLHGK